MSRPTGCRAGHSDIRMYSDADIQGLIERIKSPDEAISGAAWQSAGPYGAAAVTPLAALMADWDFELARKAKRALYLVVRHAGRPCGCRGTPSGGA